MSERSGWTVDVDNGCVFLKIDHQTFRIWTGDGEGESPDWYANQLRIALARLCSEIPILSAPFFPAPTPPPKVIRRYWLTDRQAELISRVLEAAAQQVDRASDFIRRIGGGPSSDGAMDLFDEVVQLAKKFEERP